MAGKTQTPLSVFLSDRPGCNKVMRRMTQRHIKISVYGRVNKLRKVFYVQKWMFLTRPQVRTFRPGPVLPVNVLLKVPSSDRSEASCFPLRRQCFR